MMRQFRIFIAIAIVLMAVSCSEDNNSTGSSLLSESDRIVVGCDTFSLGSEMLYAPLFISSPDSMLLGEADNMFGTIDADILTQLACPLDFRYPENSAVDSVVLFLYYRTWYGDGNSPFCLRVYEMDRGTFDYNMPYPSDISVDEYCSQDESVSLLETDRVQTAKGFTDSMATSSTTYVPVIRMKLKQSFAERFFACNDFSSQEEFNRKFKGLYLTTSFGGSTILYVNSINMAVYYHFSYDKQGNDTIVKDVKLFYANSEVRKVNRVTYPQVNLEELVKNEDSVMYVVSPANIYTRLELPMQKMSESIKDTLGRKRAYVNQAKLDVQVLNHYSGATADITRDDWAQPAEIMMLIKESSVERFFADNELPSDTCAMLASLTTTSDSIGNVLYYYTFDVSTLLTNQLRQEEDGETLNMLLVPVSVGYSTTQSTSYSSGVTSISSVRPLQTITATAIKSARDKESPMSLRVTYSGF